MAERRLSAKRLRSLLASDKDHIGVFEQLLGFRTGSAGSYKPAHLMNDLAQTVLGEPADEGDFLCHVVRCLPEHAHEGSSPQQLREHPEHGPRFCGAFPATLSPAEIQSLRLGARRLLASDNTMFRPGDRMTAPVATHRGLLGADGFRRFGIGRYVAGLLGESGRRRLSKLLGDSRDPVSRALYPLHAEWTESQPDLSPPSPTSELDQALSEGLGALLQQPLTKPMLLRFLSLAGCLAVLLKTLGAGREGGRPLLLGLAKMDHGRQELRKQAVQTFSSGVAALFEKLAELLAQQPDFLTLLSEEAAADEEALTVELPEGLSPTESARRVLQVARQKKTTFWFPLPLAESLGRKTGVVEPKNKRAGWGSRLSLPSEVVELLVLMHVPAGEDAQGWVELWRKIRRKLGVVIGVDPVGDAKVLDKAGALYVNRERLQENAERVLRAAIERGVARRLPDSGAEAAGRLL